MAPCPPSPPPSQKKFLKQKVEPEQYYPFVDGWFKKHPTSRVFVATDDSTYLAKFVARYGPVLVVGQGDVIRGSSENGGPNPHQTTSTSTSEVGCAPTPPNPPNPPSPPTPPNPPTPPTPPHASIPLSCYPPPRQLAVLPGVQEGVPSVGGLDLPEQGQLSRQGGSRLLLGL